MGWTMNLTVMSDGSEQIRYNDPRIPIYVNRGDLKSLSGMAALCHWHEDVEILMPLKGKLGYSVNGVRVTVQEGNAVFVNSRQMHYGFSLDGNDCEYVCVVFRPQLLCANEMIRNRYVIPVLTSHQFTHMILRKSVPEHRPLLNILCRIDSMYKAGLADYIMEALGCLHSFWAGIYDLSRDQIGEAVSTDVNAMVQKQMLEYMRTHYTERITLDDIAASGGVCRTKCCQIFKTYLGRSPNDYLNSFRLEKGIELLLSTRMSITEIAGACGYGSASYFTEMFTRHKGCSPSQFRKQ